MIEFWFPFSQLEQTKRLGTWCDGIPLLKLAQIDRVTFSLSGIGYFPHQIASFETEWRFKRRRDRIPDSITLRLGYVAPENQQSARQNRKPECMYNSRPTQTSDWMIEVELTKS